MHVLFVSNSVLGQNALGLLYEFCLNCADSVYEQHGADDGLIFVWKWVDFLCRHRMTEMFV